MRDTILSHNEIKQYALLVSWQLGCALLILSQTHDFILMVKVDEMIGPGKSPDAR